MAFLLAVAGETAGVSGYSMPAVVGYRRGFAIFATIRGEWHGTRTSMATGKDLRRLALALEGTTEAPHFDRAAFRVARIYVTLAADGRTANFKFTPDEQEFKCMLAPEAFSPIPNAWGRQGWTTGNLSKLGAKELRQALETAWMHAQPKKAKQPKPRPKR
jgi:hypothetical protein